ncbi:MAG: hypothetical protein ACNFW9_02295 [Candidatus Kerfeldbacteria bacterium]|jgi:hypothetical protein
MKYDIVIFGTNKFSNLNISKDNSNGYYIIHELLKRDDIGKILFIDILPVKRIQALKEIFTIFIKQFKPLIKRGVFSYCEEIQKDKLYHYSTILSIINWKSLYKDLANLVKTLAFNNLILWSHYPLNVDYFDYFKNKTSVIYLDKDWQKYKTLKKKSTIDYIDVLRKNYNEISDKADFIFTASDDLLEIFMGHNNSYWITDPNKEKIADYNWKELVEEMFSIIKTKK